MQSSRRGSRRWRPPSRLLATAAMLLATAYLQLGAGMEFELQTQVRSGHAPRLAPASASISQLR